MENKKLLEKYCHGNHWEIRPVIYAEEFMSFLRRNKLNDTQVIVDLGCGNGRDVDYFTEIGLTAIGIDNDSEIIQSAKKKYRRNKTDFFICDIERSLYPDNTISLYFCINVMHYVNQEMVLKEIHRTLKPGGYAFIHFNLLIIDENYCIDYNQKKSDVYELVRDFEIVEERIFLREDSLPMYHTHHVIQLIIRKY